MGYGGLTNKQGKKQTQQQFPHWGYIIPTLFVNKYPAWENKNHWKKHTGNPINIFCLNRSGRKGTQVIWNYYIYLFEIMTTKKNTTEAHLLSPWNVWLEWPFSLVMDWDTWPDQLYIWDYCIVICQLMEKKKGCFNFDVYRTSGWKIHFKIWLV